MLTTGKAVVELVEVLVLPLVEGVAVGWVAACAIGALVEDNAAVTPLHAESNIIEIRTMLVIARCFLFIHSS